MSLRIKALFAAVFLVTAVTGALGWHVRHDWEMRERERISRDLHDDTVDLQRMLSNTKKLASQQLELQMSSSDLRSLIRGQDFRGRPLMIRDNFLTQVNQWKKLTGADGAMATLDSLFALEKNREAKIFKTYGDLVVSAVTFDHTSNQNFEQKKQDFFENEKFFQFLQESFNEAVHSSKPKWKICTTDHSIWLIILAPFYKDNAKSEVVGQGILFFELSSSWLSRIRRDLIKSENPVLHVIYDGLQIGGHTLGDITAAKSLVQSLNHQNDTLFTIDLSLSKRKAKYIALRQHLQQGHSAQFVALKNFDVELKGLYELIKGLWVWGFILGLIGIAMAYGLSLTVVRRLDQLKRAAHQVQKGNFDIQASTKGGDEVAALASAFNNMTDGLKALGHYTDPVLAQAIIDKTDTRFASGFKTNSCVFFSDIRDFTAISENLNPEDLVYQLNEYFSKMGQSIKESRGFVDKFNGDSVMAWWGAPFIEGENLVNHACHAALSCKRVGAELRKKWKEEGRPLFHQRIGLCFGEVVVGNLGSDTKTSFTVVGDTVNLASRLETANLYYGTEILVCENTVKQAEGFLFREIDQIRVKGRFKPVRIFECLGEQEQVSQETLIVAQSYSEALDCYRKRDFVKALKILEKARQLDDDPSVWLSVRCEAFLVDPPGKDWESVTVYRDK